MSETEFILTPEVLHFQDAKSDKVYIVLMLDQVPGAGSNAIIAYGRRSQGLNADLLSAEEATIRYREKMAKGYRAMRGGLSDLADSQRMRFATAVESALTASRGAAPPLMANALVAVHDNRSLKLVKATPSGRAEAAKTLKRGANLEFWCKGAERASGGAIAA